MILHISSVLFIPPALSHLDPHFSILRIFPDFVFIFKPEFLFKKYFNIILFKWNQFYLRWLWKFGIKREEYGLDEKLYVIRKNMEMSQGQFDQLEKNDIEIFLEEEL